MLRERRPKTPPPEPEPPPSDDGVLPPHSDEAEKGVLGCILLAPDQSLASCIAAFKHGSEVFFSLKHRAIYDAALARYDQNKAIDSITMIQELRDKGALESVGGIVYLASLPDAVPSAENLSFYIDIVLKKYTLRRVINTCADLTAKAMSNPDSVHEIVTVATSTIQSVSEIGVVQDNVASTKQLVPEAMQHIEYLAQNAGVITGVTTGLIDLDAMTWGFKPGELVVLAARPSVGKTALAMNAADHIATSLRLPVGVFSLEMSKQALVVRMLCSRANVSSTAIQHGHLSQFSASQLTNASRVLVCAPIHIDDTAALSISQLRARARQMHKRFGVKIVIVDYLQLMNGGHARRHDSREQEVAAISGGLKALAKELNIPVMVLSQFSRKVEDRGNNARPKLSDLRESGAIEQDADTVLMLYRPQADITGIGPDTIATTCIVGKNRNGPTGDVDLIFAKSCTKFQSAAQPELPPSGFTGDP